MRIAALLLLTLLAAPARADITLTGEQHIGDGENAGFRPRDPVTRAQMQANPANFWLSQDATVTAIRLDDARDLDDRLQVFIDDMNTPLAGTLSGSTYTLTTPLTLAAGAHTIWPDGGCSLGGFAIPCGLGGENDFDFVSITLLSSQTTLSRNFNQRRHPGDTDDADDNYATLYPDRAEATTLSLPFTLVAARALTQVRLYRLRNVAAAPLNAPKIILDLNADGTDDAELGTLTANGSLYTIAASQTVGAGAHAIKVVAGVDVGTDHNDFSWDDLVLIFTPVSASTPGAYNAVDVATDAAVGQVTTKTAGTAFSLDLTALSGGTVLSSYTGTVAVELVNAASGTCTRYAQAASLGSVTFTAADAGRKTIATTYANALANARIRINDTANAVTSCSYDNFAIKPDGFGGITVTHADAASPGTAAALATSGFTTSTTPVHKAGRPFTVQAHAKTSGGAVATAYAGSPDLIESATIAGMGAVLGTASATGWTYPSAGYIRTDAAQYTEVGAATVALTDTTFAEVDADDTLLANRRVGPTTFGVGRFIPDHFTFAEVTAAEFVPACGTFTYAGQPFAFAATPAARVTAVAFGGTATKNYTDAGLYKIVVSPTSTYAVASGTLDATVLPNPDNTFVSEGDGKSLFTLIPPNPGYKFTRGTPVPPLDAEITIALNFTESDGVAFEAANPGDFGDSLAGGIPFSGGSNAIRYGRLVVANAQGSELQALDVPLQTEYLISAGSGFARNLADACSLLATGDLTLDAPSSIVGLPDPPGNTSIQAITDPPGGGLWALKLAAPGDPGQTRVMANVATNFPWLLTDTDLDASYDDNPFGFATFGLAKGNDRRIFQREVVGY